MEGRRTYSSNNLPTINVDAYDTPVLEVPSNQNEESHSEALLYYQLVNEKKVTASTIAPPYEYAPDPQKKIDNNAQADKDTPLNNNTQDTTEKTVRSARANTGLIGMYVNTPAEHEISPYEVPSLSSSQEHSSLSSSQEHTYDFSDAPHTSDPYMTAPIQNQNPQQELYVNTKKFEGSYVQPNIINRPPPQPQQTQDPYDQPQIKAPSQQQGQDPYDQPQIKVANQTQTTTPAPANQQSDNYGEPVNLPPKPDPVVQSPKPTPQPQQKQPVSSTADLAALVLPPKLLERDPMKNWSNLKTKSFARNWNKEFQDALELEDSKQKFFKLRNLERDFVYAAETYGRIIISENCLLNSMKTLLPVSVGGVAGGTKYICCGILFKFCVDTYNLYGGDENAMKAATHELKGLQHYYHCGLKDLRLPLMAFIDYRGWRLQAVSLLPISDNSLIYGSADGGKSVQLVNPHLNSLMEEAASKMNLKGHWVGPDDDKKFIHSCCDIEGHLGSDGRFYLLDFARVAPPQPPTARGSNLYKLFRLEFVQKYFKPLCSDAFSMMGRHDFKEHCAEIMDAFQHYSNITLPNFAEKLTETTIAEMSQIKMILHREGINCRHLGQVRTFLAPGKDRIANILLLECLARVCKTHIQTLLRIVSQRTGIPSDEPYRKTVQDLLNIIFGKSTKSETYWKNHIVKDLEQKFPGALYESEKDPSYDLQTNLLSQGSNATVLLKRILELTAIRLTPNAMQDFENKQSQFHFVDADVAELGTRISHLNIIDYADGMYLFYEALELPPNDKVTKTRLLLMAKQKLESALLSMSHNYLSMLQLGVTFLKMAKHVDSPTSFVDRAIATYQQIINYKVDAGILYTSHLMLAKAYFYYVKLCNSHGNMTEAYNNIQKAQAYLNSPELEYLWGKMLLHEASTYTAKYPDAATHLEKALTLLPQSQTTRSKEISCWIYLSVAYFSLSLGQKDATQARHQCAHYAQLAIQADPASGHKLMKKLQVEKSAKKMWYILLVANESPQLTEFIRSKLDEISIIDLTPFTVSAQDIAAFSNFSPMLKNLQALRFKNCESFAREDVLSLVNINKGSLNELRIPHTQFASEEDITALNCVNNLAVVDLSFCTHVTDTSVKVIADFMGARALELLLGCPSITDIGVQAITQCTNITVLSLAGSNITGAAIPHIQKLGHLKALLLPDCKNLEATSFDSFTHTNLEVLDTFNCLQVKQTKLDEIAKSLPKLLVIRLPHDLCNIYHNGTGSLELQLKVNAHGMGALNRILSYSYNVPNIASHNPFYQNSDLFRAQSQQHFNIFKLEVQDFPLSYFPKPNAVVSITRSPHNLATPFSITDKESTFTWGGPKILSSVVSVNFNITLQSRKYNIKGPIHLNMISSVSISDQEMQGSEIATLVLDGTLLAVPRKALTIHQKGSNVTHLLTLAYLLYIWFFIK